MMGYLLKTHSQLTGTIDVVEFQPFLLHTLGCITSNDMVLVFSEYIEKCVKISGH